MPTPTHDDPKRPTMVYAKRGETVKPCQASPHCHNLVKPDMNGVAICQSCGEDYDARSDEQESTEQI